MSIAVMIAGVLLVTKTAFECSAATGCAPLSRRLASTTSSGCGVFRQSKPCCQYTSFVRYPLLLRTLSRMLHVPSMGKPVHSDSVPYQKVPFGGFCAYGNGGTNDGFCGTVVRQAAAVPWPAAARAASPELKNTTAKRTQRSMTSAFRVDRKS